VTGCQNYEKCSMGSLGGRAGYWISKMCNLVRQLATAIVQCIIPARKDCWPKDRFMQFLGLSSQFPLEMCKVVL